MQWRHSLFLVLLLCELTLLFSPPSTFTRHQPRLLSLMQWVMPSVPPFTQIRLLHRIFASASIGISQLAGVWADAAPSDKQSMDQAIALVQSLESESEYGRNMLE